LLAFGWAKLLIQVSILSNQEGIDASYFRNKARPSQTNSLLKKNKKEDELDSGNKQV